jgi:hypothetical protein
MPKAHLLFFAASSMAPADGRVTNRHFQSITVKKIGKFATIRV